MAFTLNLRRRHLNREQRRALIAESLKKDPQLSNREHERRTGGSRNLVGRVREELVESGQLSHCDTSIGSDGKPYPASQPKREPAPDQQPHEPTATAFMSQDELDELNTPNPPRIPDLVAPPPATNKEDRRPTQVAPSPAWGVPTSQFGKLILLHYA